MQRIGRADHHLEQALARRAHSRQDRSVLECRVAIDAMAEVRGCAAPAPAGSTCARGVCCRLRLGEPRSCRTNYAEVLTSAPYAALTRTDFDDVVGFVASGGYALKPTAVRAPSSRTSGDAGASPIRR